MSDRTARFRERPCPVTPANPGGSTHCLKLLAKRKAGGTGICQDCRRPDDAMTREIDLDAEKANAVVVRHRSNHEVIAMIEIVSPGNKNSRREFDAFVEKADEILKAGIHLLIVDLFSPGPRDPQGIHRAIWGDG